MRRMARVLCMMAAVAVTFAAPASGQTDAGGAALAEAGATAGADTAAQEQLPFTLTVGSRIQVRYSYLDRDEQANVGSFGIRRGRLSLSGAAYQRFNYAVQLELAGSSVRLIDANVRYPVSPLATLWFGQGKAPFGRQQLTSSGNLNMVDRTITDGRFSAGRQIGVALIGQNMSRTFEYGAGIYNGNGINTTNTDMNYMYVGRAVWTPLGAYSLAESAHDYPENARVALGVAGLHNTQGEADVQTTVARLGLEAAFKIRGFNSTAEFYHERQSPATGAALEANGWYVQAGYLFPGRRHELATRYAVISPASPVNTDMIEMGAGHSLYFNGHRAKRQTDLRTIDRKATGSGDIELRVQFQLTL
jgi:phosphate-selective porin OprO and OprP